MNDLIPCDLGGDGIKALLTMLCQSGGNKGMGIPGSCSWYVHTAVTSEEVWALFMATISACMRHTFLACPPCCTLLKLTAGHPTLIPTKKLTIHTLGDTISYTYASSMGDIDFFVDLQLPGHVASGKASAVSTAARKAVVTQLSMGKPMVAALGSQVQVNGQLLYDHAWRLLRSMDLTVQLTPALFTQLGQLLAHMVPDLEDFRKTHDIQLRSTSYSAFHEAHAQRGVSVFSKFESKYLPTILKQTGMDTKGSPVCPSALNFMRFVAIAIAMGNGKRLPFLPLNALSPNAGGRHESCICNMNNSFPCQYVFGMSSYNVMSLIVAVGTASCPWTVNVMGLS